MVPLTPFYCDRLISCFFPIGFIIILPMMQYRRRNASSSSSFR